MALKIDQLFEQVYKIPQVPEVVRTLIVQMNDPNIDMDAIAKNVEKEQVISVKVLRLVNSAYFGLSRKIASINDAVVMLGMGKLKTLVIASGMVASIPDIPHFDVQSFWSNSFRTATIAKWLAEQTDQDADSVFTAGLISGLGTVLIYMGAPDKALTISQQVEAGNERYSIEKKCLGFTSQEVCAELCRRWKFPNELVATIEQSGDPLAFDDVLPSAGIIFIARSISEYCAAGCCEEEISDKFPFDILAQLPLSEQQLREKLPEILALESGIDGLAD